jgi:colicin import membrane protein
MHKFLLATCFVILLFEQQCLAQTSGGMPPLRIVEPKQAGTPSSKNYGATVRACIQPGVSFEPLPRIGSENPQVQHRVKLKSDGQIADVVLTKSSGNLSFDRAIERAIRNCTPFPRPPGEGYPSYIDINYNMFD